MAGQMCRLGCFLMLLALAGCQSQGMPADPLFANRKPVESKAQAGPPTERAFAEPAPPSQP